MRLAVFDRLGHAISVIMDKREAAGVHYVGFDATGLPSGMYVFQLYAAGDTVLKTDAATLLGFLSRMDQGIGIRIPSRPWSWFQLSAASDFLVQLVHRIEFRGGDAVRVASVLVV